MSQEQQRFVVHNHGSGPPCYLGIVLKKQRDGKSWWVRLFLNRKKAILWTVERHAHISGQVKISTTLGGIKVCLTSHGKSRNGAVPDLGENCFAALVHTSDDDNVIWTEQAVNVHGREGSILPKTALATLGSALAGVCYPRRHTAQGQSAEWYPLLGSCNVIVKPAAGVWNDVDLTTVWRFLAPEDQAADVSMVAEHATMLGA